jgi:ribosomal protein L11 methyltransferase
MAWIKLHLDSTREAVDWVQTLLAAHGISIEVTVASNSGQHQSEDRETPLDLSLSFFLPEGPEANRQLDDIVRIISPLHRIGMITELAMATVTEKPAPSPQRDNAPHLIGQQFAIVAGDRADYRPAREQILLYLPPSQAFGSGLHPTTVLSLMLLERHILPGMATLDLGSGSGILSVAMAKLGATVTALDNDPIAVQATRAAIRQNYVTDQVTAGAGSLGAGLTMGHWMGGTVSQDMEAIAPEIKFDLIMANLPARVNIALATTFAETMRYSPQASGLLLTTGYTVDYEADIRSALSRAGFTVIDRQQQGEWVALGHVLSKQPSK